MPSKKKKYGATAAAKVKKVLHERKAGTLKSGSGKKVTSRKQAIAIGLSEARERGAKVPKKPAAKKSKRSAKSTAKKRPAIKKRTAKPAAKKRSARK